MKDFMFLIFGIPIGGLVTFLIGLGLNIWTVALSGFITILIGINLTIIAVLYDKIYSKQQNFAKVSGK